MDAEGNLVRIISAGRGDELLFTNLDAEDKTVSLTGNGPVLKTIINPTDGTSTNQATGHNVIILFPTDITEGRPQPFTKVALCSQPLAPMNSRLLLHRVQPGTSAPNLRSQT